MVAEDHRIQVAEIGRQSLALVHFDGQTFELVVGHPVVEGNPIDLQRQQSFFQSGNRHPTLGVRVHHAMHIRARRVNRAVNDETGEIDVFLTFRRAAVYHLAIEIDGYEVGSGNLVVAQAEAIDQKMFGAGDLGGDVIPDDVRETEHVSKPIAGREIQPRAPLGAGITGAVIRALQCHWKPPPVTC